MDHDGGYHLLFSHPQMVADLLRGFVSEPWAARLDLSTLERVNAKFHADGLERRDGDVIWRVRTLDGEYAYLYIVLEFQSSPDHWMAVRVMVYVGLLYLHLIREKLVDPNRPLPPVFPVVFYNGKDEWRKARDVGELVGLAPDGTPWAWRPRMQYHLLDELRYNTTDVNGGSDNVVAILIEMEQCRTVEELHSRVTRVVELLSGEENASLRRAFTSWLTTVLGPARGLNLRRTDVTELSEVRDVLAERVREWEQGWYEQGRVKGEALALIRLIERRFGPLPSEMRDQIMAADAATIEGWLDRLMDAPNLSAVFDDRPTS
ncbi:DUF4351 domain-containing protein [Azospirillaceae bacterium]